jgi:putative membrane protein
MDYKNWQQQGQEPDYRFSLANERTFLAWIRTALAILASGVALDQLVLHSAGTNAPRSRCSVVRAARN